VLEECSLLESPLGALLLDDEDDESRCVVLVTGAIGATTTGTGATTTGAAYTTAGAGAEAVVVVVLELVVSVESAKAIDALPNSAAMLKAKVAVLNEYFIMGLR
jgi:hypothetical protein